jgi:8-oxo-dGTP diphosphatase
MCEKEIILCVDGFFIKDNKILLVKRNVDPFKGYWHLVGGRVEDSENLREALKREYKEETNLEIEAGDIIDFRIEHTHDRTKIVLILEVVQANGKIELNYENSEYKWFAETPLSSVCNYDSYFKRERR